MFNIEEKCKQFKEDYFEKGFVLTSLPELCELIDINSIQWTDQSFKKCAIPVMNPELEKQIELVYSIINKEIVGKFWSKVTEEYGELNWGFDTPTTEWHTDYVPDKINICTLLYYDDLDEETGGEIEIRRKIDGVLTGRHYPQRNDVIILNQLPNFEHRVNDLKMSIPRRTANFHFWVE